MNLFKFIFIFDKGIQMTALVTTGFNLQKSGAYVKIRMCSGHDLIWYKKYICEFQWEYICIRILVFADYMVLDKEIFTSVYDI